MKIRSLIIIIISGVTMLWSMDNFIQIEREINSGNFEKACRKIDNLIAGGRLSDEEILYLRDREQILDRIRLDFRLTEDDIIKYLRPYFPDLDQKQLRDWEDRRVLEMMRIDGRKMYFSQAGRNLFRQDSTAGARKIEVDGVQKDGLDEFLKTYLPSTVKTIGASPDVNGPWQKMRISYRITLDADAVPPGETVRAWLPFPREHEGRQSKIRLIETSEPDYIIAPNSSLQRSLYLQKTAEEGKPTVFSCIYEFSTRAQWYDLNPNKIRPYDKNSPLYREFTAERKHIQFSDGIRELSDRIVGKEKNPYKIVRMLFNYISDNYPWASAREYSTIDNIPEYVMQNSKGDCGQVTLLLMTLARYNGIPAKWQSGWMLHPGEVNLHDWCEVYFEGIGWVPVDQSFGMRDSDNPDVRFYYSNGIDAYRMIVNDDFGTPFFPAKTHLRSETVDFQRGELEWRGGNLYFNHWDYHMDVEYLKQ